METRALKVSNTGLTLFELREYGSKTSFFKRFQNFIENTEWDEEILRQLKWVDGCACAFVIAAVLYVACVGIFAIH